MARIIPFKGIRPAKDKVHLVASRSVDSYSRTEINEKLRGNPFTYLHVINPDFKDGIITKPGSIERLLKSKQRYEEFCAKEYFLVDQQPAYYIYRQLKDGNTYTGIIGCIHIDDYFNGTIKIHEQTITQREEKLKEYLEVCDFNAEPVLFCYPDNNIINKYVKETTQLEPSYDYSTTDLVRHKLWVINNQEVLHAIEVAFSNTPSIYIADGHHRSASSALLGKSRREQNPKHKGDEPYNFYLGIFFPESELKIFDFNRAVKDLNGLTYNLFLERVNAFFDVTTVSETNFKPKEKHNFGMYLNGQWYSLYPKKGCYDPIDAVKSLDASILTSLILAPILGIHDLKTDKRISFVPGVKGTHALKELVDTGKMKVSFALYPVEMKQLKHIADTNSIMPPKTTWVEPKLRSGLVIYPLS